MKRTIRPWLILGGLAVVASLTFWFVPNPFVRGIVIGTTAGPGLLIAGLVLLTRRMRRKHGGQLRAPPLPVAKWDYAMTVSDLSGADLEFNEFEGRVLILNFWATWCGPCIAEMPSLARLAEATSDVDVVLACVTREPAAAVSDFMKKRDLDVPMYLLEGDPPECFATRAIPATFVLDKKGAVVLSHRGAAAWDDDNVVEFVRGLAAVPNL